MKHPESFKNLDVQDTIDMVKNALIEPDVVVEEKLDPSVHLYYKKLDGYSICVVAKHLNGDGCIITSYRTDRIKKGETIWKRE